MGVVPPCEMLTQGPEATTTGREVIRLILSTLAGSTPNTQQQNLTFFFLRLLLGCSIRCHVNV